MYTENQLNGMTKAQIIDVAQKLSTKVETMSGGPVTADSIKAEYLSLKKEGVDIAERRQVSVQNHLEALADIEANKEKAIAELKLKFSFTENLDSDLITSRYEELEKKSLKAIDDLSFGLEKAENDAEVTLKMLREEISRIQEEFEEKEAKLHSEMKIMIERNKADMEAVKLSFSRDLEQLNYSNNLELRNENYTFLKKAASHFKMELISIEDLERHLSFIEADDVKINDLINEAVDQASRKIYSTEGAKASNLKFTSDNKISLLENDRMHLESSIQSQKTRIEELELRLKDVPFQIAEAVKASQSQVTVNQDSSKK